MRASLKNTHRRHMLRLRVGAHMSDLRSYQTPLSGNDRSLYSRSARGEGLSVILKKWARVDSPSHLPSGQCN